MEFDIPCRAHVDLKITKLGESLHYDVTITSNGCEFMSTNAFTIKMSATQATSKMIASQNSDFFYLTFFVIFIVIFMFVGAFYERKKYDKDIKRIMDM